jgi:hypothetical protein
MATFSITIDFNTGTNGPAALEVLNSLCTYWGYAGADTTPAKTAFVKSKGADFFKDSYVASKAVPDGEAARVASKATAEMITVT